MSAVLPASPLASPSKPRGAAELAETWTESWITNGSSSLSQETKESQAHLAFWETLQEMPTPEPHQEPEAQSPLPRDTVGFSKASAMTHPLTVPLCLELNHFQACLPPELSILYVLQDPAGLFQKPTPI